MRLGNPGFGSHPTMFGKELTGEEEAMMGLLAQGVLMKNLPHILGCSATRVQQRSDFIRSKLGANTMAHAMALWVRGK